MSDPIGDEVGVGDVLGDEFKDRPFLHEQGQVVVRGYVQSLEVSETDWTMTARDIETLDKGSGTWSRVEAIETYCGPVDQTVFYRCRSGPCPPSEPAVQIRCYGMLIHIGVSADDPWRHNHWPDLDTEFLPAEMRSDGAGT